MKDALNLKRKRDQTNCLSQNISCKLFQKLANNISYHQSITTLLLETYPSAEENNFKFQL